MRGCIYGQPGLDFSNRSTQPRRDCRRASRCRAGYRSEMEENDMSANVAVRPLLLKPQWMNGLSERLLMSHYVNNYGGALRRLNAIRARLATLNWGRTPVFEINGVQREELMAAVSVILHEIYFDSLGGHGDNPPTGLDEPPAGLAEALQRDFGSIAAWRAEFTAMAKALAGGSGWAILPLSEQLVRLVNQWSSNHEHGLPGPTPILALG